MSAADLKQAHEQFGEIFASILEGLVQETLACAEEMESSLAKADSWDDPLFNVVLRKLHTLKGIFAQAGFKDIAASVHHFEEFFVPLRDAKALPETSLLIPCLDVVDALKSVIDALSPQGDKAALDAATQTLAFHVGQFAGKVEKTPAAESAGSSDAQKSAAAEPQDESGAQAKKAPPAESKMLSMPESAFENVFYSLRELVEFLSRQERTQVLEARLRSAQGAMYSMVQARTSPAGTLATRFRRLVSEVSTKLGKQIDFKLEGFEANLDRKLLQLLAEALTHMLRNGCDHGIEPPDARRQAGKPARATLRLALEQIGDRTVVLLEDDGAGIDPGAVGRKALNKGFITQAELDAMTRYEVQELIFKPGFSTKEQATDISGRGVGLDAVAKAVQSGGGILTFESAPGEGTKFRLEFPAAYQLAPAVLFRYGASTYALPAKLVIAVVSDPSEMLIEYGAATVPWSEETFALLHLRDIDPGPQTDCGRPAILLSLAGAAACLPVDSIVAVGNPLLLNTPSGGLPPYLNGAGFDPVHGAVIGVDATELERNFNLYLQADEMEAPTPLHANEPQLSVGTPLSIGSLMNKVSDDEFLGRVAELLAPLESQREIHESLVRFACDEIAGFRAAIDEVEDESDLATIFALRFVAIKSNWMLMNNVIQRKTATTEQGPDPFLVYKASLTSLFLETVEPHLPTALIDGIARALAEPHTSFLKVV